MTQKTRTEACVFLYVLMSRDYNNKIHKALTIYIYSTTLKHSVRVCVCVCLCLCCGGCTLSDDNDVGLLGFENFLIISLVSNYIYTKV